MKTTEWCEKWQNRATGRHGGRDSASPNTSGKRRWHLQIWRPARTLGHRWEKMERIIRNKVKEDIRDIGKLVRRDRTEKWRRWGISGGKVIQRGISDVIPMQMKSLCGRKCRMYTKKTSSLKGFFFHWWNKSWDTLNSNNLKKKSQSKIFSFADLRGPSES